MLARQLSERTEPRPDGQVGAASTPKLARLSLLQTRSSLSATAPKPESEGGAPPPAPSATAAAEASPAPPGSTDAFALLDEVKRFIPLLLKENDELRAALEAQQSKAQAEIRTLEDQAREWQAVADELTMEVTSLGATVLDLRTRLETAETVAAGEREAASKASQQAAEAECLSKLFEDTVISSFGIGTMFQNAMARIGSK